ncbi:rhodanese-like domain-containing protein [Staphylospora marina]|uniref:rhodanese-like domain-containing protein n=1 Tax=Staphylospora marina TaxID=2490858 RepID=UPI001F155D3F|nr:rhodanese-like domain-containing protein [Staphylospora marina]
MKVRELEAKELSARFEQLDGDFSLLVDVRTEEEFAEGHIPGAILIPHDQMERRWEEVAAYRDEPVLLICRSGRRSLMAAEVLAGRGFAKVYNLKGGMLEWTGPVVRD